MTEKNTGWYRFQIVEHDESGLNFWNGIPFVIVRLLFLKLSSKTQNWLVTWIQMYFIITP